MSRLNPVVFVVLLLGLSTIGIFLELGRMDVSTDNEGQRAAPPAEMIRSGDFVVPTLNGAPYLKKPPLLYWAIAGLYRLTGQVTAGIARIPTAVCAVLLVLAVYLVFRRLVDETPARWAALMLLGAPYFLERARWANLDVPLLLFTFLAVAGLYAAWRSRGRGQGIGLAVLSGLALGAATMLKGPPPYLFVAGAWLAWVLLQSEEAALHRALLWAALCMAVGLVFMFIPIGFPVALALLVTGWIVIVFRDAGRAALPSLGLTLIAIVVAVAVAAPWAVAVLQRDDWGSPADLIRGEVTERTHTATTINSGSPLYYFLALPAMLAPGGLLLFAFLFPSNWRYANPHYRFGLAMSVISILIFSLIAGKEYEYILPAVPWLLLALSVRVADWDAQAGDAPAGYRAWCAGLGPLLLAGAVGVPVYALIDGGDRMLIAELSALALVAVALMIWPPARRDTVGRILVTGLLVVLGVLLIRSFDYRGARSPKAIGEVCRALAAAGYPVEATKVYPHFTYYAEHPIAENVDLAAVREKLLGDVPYFYLTREKLMEEFGAAFPEGVQVVMGPYSNKELVLLTNAAGAEAPELE